LQPYFQYIKLSMVEVGGGRLAAFFIFFSIICEFCRYNCDFWTILARFRV